jgi:hypothetical protein
VVEEEAIAEVSPAVEEVAAPSAGYGETDNSLPWGAAAAVRLLDLGGRDGAPQIGSEHSDELSSS